MFYGIHVHEVDPPHPLVCCKTELGGPSDGTGKTEVPCLKRCGTIKIPPSSKALSAEHRPKFLQPFTGNGDVSIL
jgi:hypothetical protein